MPKRRIYSPLMFWSNIFSRFCRVLWCRIKRKGERSNFTLLLMQWMHACMHCLQMFLHAPKSSSVCSGCRPRCMWWRPMPTRRQPSWHPLTDKQNKFRNSLIGSFNSYSSINLSGDVQRIYVSWFDLQVEFMFCIFSTLITIEYFLLSIYECIYILFQFISQTERIIKERKYMF